MRIHIALDVRNLKAAEAFYATLLGQAAFRTQPGYVQFLTDRLNLALSEGPSALPSAGHFGFEVESPADVEASLARIRAADMAVEVESDVVCCYARQEKFWAVDPDGNRWETFFVRERHMDPALPVTSGCCSPA